MTVKRHAEIALVLSLALLTACQADTGPSVNTPAVIATASPETTTTVAITPSPMPVVTSGRTSEPAPAPTSVPICVYAPTVDMSFEELVGDGGYDEYPKGFPFPGTYRVIVDIYHQTVLVYSCGGDGEYNVPVRYMLCSTGDNTPTGTFDMLEYHVRFGKFNSLGMCGQYWSQIRNRIYFHSILYYKKDASTYDEESYSNLGNPGTPGCVYLTVPDARWIYYNIAPGTVIEIRDGSADDKSTSDIRAQLVLAPLPKNRVTLEKGGVPYTDNWTIEEVPAEVPFVQGSQK